MMGKEAMSFTAVRGDRRTTYVCGTVVVCIYMHERSKRREEGSTHAFAPKLKKNYQIA